MHIFTDRIEQHRFNGSIRPKLQKHSQEYRALATLKYYFPEIYSSFTAGDAPDLQDNVSKTGVEVTAAVSETDMQITRAFNDFCTLGHEDDSRTLIHTMDVIEKAGYSVNGTPVGYTLVSPLLSSHSEKRIVLNSISRKIKKLDQYRQEYKRIELVLILPEIPTSELESQLINWIIETLNGVERGFDYVHVICDRFYQGYNTNSKEIVSISISKEEHIALSKIGRMTAEGIISFDSEEWN